MNTENRYQETDLGNVSPNPRGEYTPGTEYEYLDLVTFDGGSYICVVELGTTTSISPEPGKNTDFWQCMTIPGDMTPEYVAMHDRVVNLSEQVEADAEEVRTAEQNVSGMKENVTQMQEQTRQYAESAEQSKDSAAGYAASADISRRAAETSEQNINAQVTGFDAHVAEKTSESEQSIEAARIAANKAILAQQEQSVNEVARVGGTAVSEAQAAARVATEKASAASESEKNAKASETAAKLSETNATKMAEQVAADKEQVANDRAAVENAKQEMTGSVAQIDQNTQGIADLKGDLGKLEFVEGGSPIKEIYINSKGVEAGISKLHIIHASSGNYDILFSNAQGNSYKGMTMNYTEPKHGILPIYNIQDYGGVLFGYCIVDWNNADGNYVKPLNEKAFNIDYSPTIKEHINELSSKCVPTDTKDMFEEEIAVGTFPYLAPRYVPDNNAFYKFKFSLSASGIQKFAFVENHIGGHNYGSYFRIDNEHLYIHKALNGTSFEETEVLYSYDLGWKITDASYLWTYFEVIRNGEYFTFKIYKEDLSYTFETTVKSKPMKFIDYTTGNFGLDIGLMHGQLYLDGQGNVIEAKQYAKTYAPTILFIGDSISEGFGCIDKDKRYTELLNKRYGGNCVSVAVAGGNATTYGLSVINSTYMFNPDYICIYLGTNVDPTFRESIAKIISTAKSKATKGVLLCTIPLNLYDSAWLRENYTNDDEVQICDLESVLSPNGVKQEQYYTMIDEQGHEYSEVHPNELGQLAIYRKIISDAIIN